MPLLILIPELLALQQQSSLVQRQLPTQGCVLCSPQRLELDKVFISTISMVITYMPFLSIQYILNLSLSGSQQDSLFNYSNLTGHSHSVQKCVCHSLATTVFMNKLKKGVATSALHDTATRQNDDTSECHPNTRRDLLAQLIDKPAFVKSLIHWFYGPAGAGKTSIMRSLAKALERSNHHLASFYFWRSDGTRNSLRAFVATLAFQIAQQVKPIVPYMEQVLADDDLLLDKSNPTQLEKLVIEPLLALQASNPTAQYPRFIVIDGLDECVEEGQLEFLQTLLPALLTRLSALRLTVYIASRPETLIESEFNAPLLRDVSNRIFLEPSPEDVREFLTAEFEKVNQRYPKLKEKYRGKWPGDEDLEVLCEKSSGYFILSKTAMRHINPPVLRGRAPDRRLSDILEAFMAEPYRPLDALYLHLLRQHAPQDLTDLAEWKKLIGFVCISLYEDLGFWGICLGSLSNARFQIFGKSRSDLAEAFGSLQSLIYIDSRSGRPKNYHASFPDFVFNPERSGDFYVDPGLLHEQLACILIRNFNRIGDPGGASPDPTSPFNHLIIIVLQTLSVEIVRVSPRRPFSFTPTLHDFPMILRKRPKNSIGTKFAVPSVTMGE